MVTVIADDADRAPRQYTAGFLAGSFGLSLKEAREILARAADDRTVAAELARQSRAAARI